jgi:aminopeptidase N
VLQATLLKFPSEQEIAARLARDVDADAVRSARDAAMSEIAVESRGALLAVLERSKESGDYQPDQAGTARRSLRYAAMGLLARGDEAAALAVAGQDFNSAGAISAVLHLADNGVSEMLNQYFERHRNDALLLDKWFMFEGARPLANAAVHVAGMLAHPEFKFTTPNRVYALLGGFTCNQAGFHAADGAGYTLLADSIITLNGINPQVASRMATQFRSWRLFNAVRLGKAEAQMRRILAIPALSRDVYEIISRTLSG